MLSIAVACALQVVVQQSTTVQRPYQQLCIYPPSYGAHTIQVAATGTSETYYAWGPPGFGNGPLLVLFHSYQKDHLEWLEAIWDNYDIIDEAVNRGWYVIMHDGGQSACSSTSFTTYGDDSFQEHTEAVIRDAICRFNINKNRIYGYGLSMGGEEALAYAARHRHPTSNEGFFAAVFNHSGYYSPIYQHSGAQQMPSECGGFPTCVYGGGYCDDPYRWRRATVLDLVIPCPSNYAGPWPPTENDINFYMSQIHNLARTPLRSYYSLGEDSCMTDMNDLLALFLQNTYAVTGHLEVFDCMTSNCDSIDPDCTPNRHQWDAVCADAALDWLEQHTRDSVMTQYYQGQGILLCAEDNKRYYDFKVVRNDPDDFGRIHWFKPTSSGSIGFLRMNPGLGVGTPNITELTILAGSPYLTFLDPTQNVSIHSNYATVMRVGGYPNPPTDVILAGSGSQPFTHDPASKTVSFTTGNPPMTEVWTILP